MSDNSSEVHGESITDGDASGGIAVTLYEKASVTEREALGASEVLYVTDFTIGCETGANVSLVADGKVAGEYLFHATLDAKDVVVVHLKKPYACAKGTGLIFFGASTNLNTCIIEGFIASA